ncbi:phosphatase PAP2 family protein [Algoriphagus halophytocola]|uniref:phosphatase PAP2 family protein n=1 Tax=Algoriphagus halophytocola TaxID=2991499 RepID=UPI0022DCFB37|nr:phosphatase PAP2 family protein [Algoriphagus sp. TR-M9]WBL43134.1 phosphatase PAP2 family protein [Algoriphagus sp. TR-M9]
MKKIQLLSILFVFLVMASCNKDLNTELRYESYEFSGIDEDAGDWKPILISHGSELEIPAPSSEDSPEYLEEIEQAKSLISSMTESQKENLEFWTNNAVLRWNEVALALIAKYNLIPGPNVDESYTLPDPNNPAGPPPFPFSHPPYASRALAYLSVAQFDGLISAWHHKFQFNRKAPYQVDATIPHAYVDNGLPSYPSEGAVLATVSRKVLTAMFPLEAEYLASLEEKHLESLILSGENVQSDLEAGMKIGEEIGSIALTRASNDGMKYAQSPKAVSDSLRQAAFDRFGWQWENLESPKRPVGLTPLFGQVKMWSVPYVEATRPEVPPAPGSEAFEADIKILKNYADNMTEEYRRIANFWQDGLGTYTPPGHWNDIAGEFILKYKFNSIRTARAFAYMNMAIMDGGISCWDAKYYYYYPRPIQLIEGFETIAGTPNFPSYTSGHSVFSAAAAETLTYLFPQEGSIFMEWAEEAAISRVYGGIHWTFDATVGTTQGINVAQYTIDVAKQDGADN